MILSAPIIIPVIPPTKKVKEHINTIIFASPLNRSPLSPSAPDAINQSITQNPETRINNQSGPFEDSHIEPNIIMRPMNSIPNARSPLVILLNIGYNLIVDMSNYCYRLRCWDKYSSKKTKKSLKETLLRWRIYQRFFYCNH